MFSEKFLFLHYPKTAGKTLSRYFVQAWNGRLECFFSKGQLNEVKDVVRDNIHIHLARGHENFSQSLALFENANFKNKQPEVVFVCTRNPYDLAVSSYFFHRERASYYPENEIFQLAATESLHGYWEKVTPPNPRNWYRCSQFKDGRIEVIRFESMAEDLERLSSKYGFKHTSIDHLNPSNRKPYKFYLDKDLESMIFTKLRFFFEEGFYSREIFD